MSKKKPTKSEELNNEYNILMSTLRSLTIRELIELYLEAKTDRRQDESDIPLFYLEALEDLEIVINNYISENILNDIFNKDTN
jgi:hypothetical protein